MDNICYVCKNVIHDENCDFECSDCDFVLCTNCHIKNGKDLCVEHPYNQECLMCNKRVMLYNTKQIEKIKTVLNSSIEKIDKSQMLEINKIYFT